jgi:hypothetical protein
MDPTWSTADWKLPPNKHGRDQWMLGFATLGGAALALPFGAALHLTEAGLAWTLAAAFTGVGLLGAARLHKYLARPPRDAEALAELLQASGIFDLIVGPRVANSLAIPVVVERGRHRTLASASVASALLSATDTTRSIELRAVVRSVSWPRSSHRQSRLLPRRWIAVELAGANAWLSPLPWLCGDARGSLLRGVVADRDRAALEVGGELIQSLRLASAKQLARGFEARFERR